VADAEAPGARRARAALAARPGVGDAAGGAGVARTDARCARALCARCARSGCCAWCWAGSRHGGAAGWEPLDDALVEVGPELETSLRLRERTFRGEVRRKQARLLD
jgi:hypothetical protein